MNDKKNLNAPKLRRNSWAWRKYLKFKAEFQREFLSERPSRLIQNILFVVVGNIILAFAASIFLIPANIVTGGTSGIALVIMKIVSLITGNPVATSYGIIDINFIITLLTIFFFILGLFIVGFSFSLKTLISTIVYPIFVYIFDLIRNIQPGQNWLRLENYVRNGNFTDYLNTPNVVAIYILAGIFGGALMGLGVALSFKGGGSTGGTDCIIIALDKHTRFKANTISVLIDSIIIIIGMIVNQNLLLGLIGILSAVITAFMIGKVFVGSSSILHADINSIRWKEISDAINHEMERGTTIYEAKGGYTGLERKVVSVYFSKDEYRVFMRILDNIDKSAFVTISTVSEVQGYGFSYNDEDRPKKIAESYPKESIEKFESKEKKENAKIEAEKEKQLRKDLKAVKKQERKERN